MPLQAEDQRHVTSAEGYVELGMFAEADAELDQVDSWVRHVPDVLTVRLAIYRKLKKWELAESVARRLSQFDRENVKWVIAWAEATREMDSLEFAHRILLEALEFNANESSLYFTIACYEAQLGKFETAKERLAMAFQLNPALRSAALAAEDLRPVWDSLATSFPP